MAPANKPKHAHAGGAPSLNARHAVLDPRAVLRSMSQLLRRMQAAPSTLNPLTCWDWWGYTGLTYYTRDAPQIKAVDAMIRALAKSSP